MVLEPVVASVEPQEATVVALVARVTEMPILAPLASTLLVPILLVLTLPVLTLLVPTPLASVLVLLAGCCLEGQSPARAESVPVMAVVEILQLAATKALL